MDRPDILVKVGAAFDRSFDVVLANAQKKWERAFGAGQRVSGGNGQTALAVNSAKDIARQQEAIARKAAAVGVQIERDKYREASRLNRLLLAEQARTERANNAAAVKAARDRTRERLKGIREEERAEASYQDRLTRMKQAAMRRETAQQVAASRAQRQAEHKQAREIDRFATRTSHRATRFFFPPPEGMLGYAKRTALDVARGAGVDFSLGGGVSRAKERETAGMGLAQQERIAQGGTSRGGAAWAAKSLEVGTDLKVDPAQVTAMIRAFTGKTGDFAAAADKARELASMTLASGANMDEMGSAAGYVYNQLKGMPDAAERTLDVMRGIVGQTAVGAVEMEEYAKQMGRIAANAKMFQGDVSKNILELSALTQLSIAEGGATSGADAARSIAAFANTTSKGMRINAFKKQGVELFNESGTQKRPILDIIKDSLIASKGNIPAMTKMWADTLGQKPIRGLTNAFNEAGGGEAGWQAALKKIEPFMKAQLDKETERKNLEDYNKTIAARAQAFQNNLDRITEAMANRLLPAMESLAPTVLSLSSKFSGLASWAAENPAKAIVSALTLAIGRAGLESVGRLFLDRLMAGVAGQAMGGAATGALGGLSSGAGAVAAGGGLMGTLGVVAALAAVGVGAYTLTSSLLELSDKLHQETEKKQAEDMNKTFFDASSKINAAKNPLERQQAYQTAIDKITASETARTGSASPKDWSQAAHETARALRHMIEDPNIGKPRTVAGREMENMGYDNVASRMTPTEISQALVGALTGKTINVKVSNFDEVQFTPADGSTAEPERKWF